MYRQFSIESDGVEVSVGKRKKTTELTGNHRHQYYELYYMAVGHAKFFMENEIININCGDVMIVRKDILHKTVYEPDHYTERLLISFTEEFTGENMLPVINSCKKNWIVYI